MKPFAIALAVACVTTQVRASECKVSPPKVIAQAAQVAFLGAVISVEESAYKPMHMCWDRSVHGSDCGGKLVTLQVTDHLRGRVDSKVTVVSGDACYCLGPYWKSGMQYVIVAERNITDVPGQFVASNQYWGTMEISKATQPIAEHHQGAAGVQAMRAPPCVKGTCLRQTLYVER